MIISSEIKTVFDKQGRLRKKTIWHLRCDNLMCQVDFVGRQKTKSGLHFHSKKCMEIASRIDGPLFQYKTKIYQERFGVNNPFQSQQIKQQICDNNIKKYGVAYQQQREEIKKKTIETNLIRYGSTTPLTQLGMSSKLGIKASSQKSKEKRRQTCLKRYGVDHPSKDRQIQLKIQSKLSNTTSKIHWKTKEELMCRASYEVAFVNWCNYYQIDFDWQVPYLLPDGRTYYVDAFIKDGEFANTWIEIKGYFIDDANSKWSKFHLDHPNNSQLWNCEKLSELGILVEGHPNTKFI